MIRMNDNAIYSVYMHISPDGKRYIGQCKDINRRWKKGGIGYKKTMHIFGLIFRNTAGITLNTL